MTELFRDRKTNFSNLRAAIERLEDVSSGRRGDLFRLVEMIEVKTTRDGACYLTREQLAGALYWGTSKFDDVRRLAERIGFIRVSREIRAAGGQGANRWQVDWIKIANFRGEKVVENSRGAGTANREPGTAEREADPEIREPGTAEREADPEIREARNRRAGARSPLTSPPTTPLTNTTHTSGEGEGGVWKFSFEEGELRGVRRGDLESLPAFRRLWEAAVLAGIANQGDLLDWLAAREHALRTGKDPSALFAWTVNSGDFSKIANADEDRARQVLRDFLPEPAARSPPALAAAKDLFSVPLGEGNKSREEQLAELNSKYERRTDG